MDPELSPHEKERIERLRRAMYSRELSEKLHERERRDLTPTRDGVRDDWKRDNDTLPSTVVAPRSIGVARHLLWWLFGVAALFFIGAISFFVYYFTIGAGNFPAVPGNIDIAISGPPQVPGGQASELQIVVTNRNQVPLELADLIITYPKGTRSPNDFVTDLPNQRISLGAIAPGDRRQGTVKAVLAGNEGDRAVVHVELEYHLSGSSAIFSTASDYSFTFSSSALSVSVDGNDQTISGQPVQMVVTVTSNSSAPIKDVLLSTEYPFGFKFTSASPAPISTGLWSLGDFAPGAKRSVTIQGTLSGESADERVFNFTAGTRKTPTIQQVDTPLSSIPFHMTISQPFLKLAILVNKGSDPTVIVAPGDTVNIDVNWQNNLPTAITDAVIVARIAGMNIDGSRVKSIDGFYRSSDSSMFWDKTTTNGALSNLAPGDHGKVEFSFQMPSSDDLKGVTNPHLDIAVNAAGNRVSETGVPESLQSTVRQKIAVASNLQFIAQGLYYQNPFGSTGPMPPKANSESTYAIVFTINNTTNKITGGIVKATLPPYVRWIGKYSPPSENVVFNQANSTLTWNMGDIEPGVGLNHVPPRQAAIAVGFTPSTSQIGQEPVLLQNIKFEGTDSATGGVITRTLEPVTSNLALPSKSSSDIVVGSDQGFSPANATVVK